MPAGWHEQFATQRLNDFGIIHGRVPVLASASQTCSSMYFVVNCRTESISDTLLIMLRFLSSYKAGMMEDGFHSIDWIARFCSILPISNIPGSGNSLFKLQAD